MIKVNGEEFDAAGKSLAQFLEENGYQRNQIAVECNEAIVPKRDYDKKILKNGDVLEVVSFVGGG